MKKYIRGLESHFTHTGYLYGFIPIFCSINADAIEARYWWSEYLMDFVDYGVRYLSFTPVILFIKER